MQRRIRTDQIPPAPQQLPNPLPSHVCSNGKPHRPFGEIRLELVGRRDTEVVVGYRIIGSLVRRPRVVDCGEFVLRLIETKSSLKVSDTVDEIPAAPGPCEIDAVPGPGNDRPDPVFGTPEVASGRLSEEGPARMTDVVCFVIAVLVDVEGEIELARALFSMTHNPPPAWDGPIKLFKLHAVNKGL